MAGYWMRETGPIADMMNGIEKAVASRTLTTADWSNTRLVRGEAVHAVKELKAETGRDVFVFGSADLLASLLSAGLVDEYRLCLVPRVLGRGNPLFKPAEKPIAMTLLASRPLKTGGVILAYRIGT